MPGIARQSFKEKPKLRISLQDLPMFKGGQFSSLFTLCYTMQGEHLQPNPVHTVHSQLLVGWKKGNTLNKTATILMKKKMTTTMMTF